MITDLTLLTLVQGVILVPVAQDHGPTKAHKTHCLDTQDDYENYNLGGNNSHTSSAALFQDRCMEIDIKNGAWLDFPTSKTNFKNVFF